MKKPSVTIGISAHNESKNIKSLLRQLLDQKQTNWSLHKISIKCDGCTDNTAAVARTLKSKYITVEEDGLRKGKVGRVQEIFRELKSDLVVILDADIKLKNSLVISELVSAFSNKHVELVGGNTQPFAPKTFVERSVYSTFRVFEMARKELHNGNNIFGCNGGCIASTSKYARSVTFPNVINEDDYLYFECLKRGKLFRHAPKAVVYYKLPKTFSDHFKQVFRSDSNAVVINFKDYFGEAVEAGYHRSFSFYLKSIVTAFIADPIPTVIMIVLRAVCLPLIPVISKNYKLSWYTAASTK